MLDFALQFVGLFCVGLAAGITVCVLLMERVFSGSGQFFTEWMQLMVRALTGPGPALGVLSMVAMAADASGLFKRGGGVPFWLCVGALALNLVALALTRLGHFPINDVIATWNPSSPPPDWAEVHARWTGFHVGRTASVVGSFSLYLWRVLLKS